MSKSLSKKQIFKGLKENCEKTIVENIDKFNSLLENLKENVAFLENVRKKIVEKNVIDVQKKLDFLEEKEDLKFNQNKIESIIIDSIKITGTLEKQVYYSGLFSGLIYGLIFSTFVLGVIFIYFIQQSGMYISKELFTDPNQYNIVFKSMSFGQNPLFAKIGLVVILLITTLSSIFISKTIQNNLNLKKVNKYDKNIGEFELQVGDKSILINDINIHLDKYIKALKIYSALLSEESGKLDRIIFFDKHSEIEGTGKRMVDISNTQEILFNLDQLISTDILTDKGLISVDSIGALNNSVDYLNTYVESLYSK